MLIDTHCHLPENPGAQIEAAQEWGVTHFINVGTNVKDSLAAIETANKFQNVYATAGIYPHEEQNTPIETLEKQLEDILNSSSLKPTAIGECGIDISNWSNQRPHADQIALFEMQVNIAQKYKLPLSIHNRNGNREILETLKGKNVKGVFHCFSQSWEFAKKALDMGFYISFSGMITYPQKEILLEVAKKVPLEKFMVETDAPSLPMQAHRGQKNEPKYVKMVAQKIAEIKSVPFDVICTCTSQNACALFNLT